MAGRPLRRAMIEELEKRTKAYFDDEDHSVLDYAIAQIESGEPIAAIARSLSPIMDRQISREMLRSYLYSFPNAPERIAKARPVLGEALAEDALYIVDSSGSDKGEVAQASMRARMRESLARMFNPDFQPNKQPAVQLNVASLHLAAITSPMLAATPARSLEQPLGQTGGMLSGPAPAVTVASESKEVA